MEVCSTGKSERGSNHWALGTRFLPVTGQACAFLSYHEQEFGQDSLLPLRCSDLEGRGKLLHYLTGSYFWDDGQQTASVVKMLVFC